MRKSHQKLNVVNPLHQQQKRPGSLPADLPLNKLAISVVFQNVTSIGLRNEFNLRKSP